MAASEGHVKDLVVPTELKALLRDYPALRVDEKKGKVCCCLTGHEMPLREDAVRSYVQGKKFLKAQEKREYDFEQYMPHLVPNTKKGFRHTLFCTLTLRTVTKRPADVERHVSGKRYLRALKRWQKCQETGEKFKPRGGRRKHADPGVYGDESVSGSKHGGGGTQDFWELGSDDDDDVDDSELNELDDLYPSEDFPLPVDDDTGRDHEPEGTEESSDSDSDTEATKPAPLKKAVNGQTSQTAVKRKKPQKPGGKKKRT